MRPDPNSGQRRRWLAPVLSYSIAAVCLYLVFRDISLQELIASTPRIVWNWVALAVVLDLLGYVCVAWQWQLTLRPVGNLPLLKLAQAVFAGRFANDVLPVHVGYVIRVYLAARWLRVEISRVIPSLLLERMCEGFWLAAGIALTAGFVRLPPEVARTGAILGTVLGLGFLMTLFLIRRKRQPRDSAGWLGRAVGRIMLFAQTLAEGVHSIAGSGLLAAIMAVSLLKLIVQGLAFLSLLWAYGIALPFWVQLAVFLIACVGISLPSTPASAGVFQLFCVAALTLFGVPKPVATGFSLLAFVVLTLPLAIMGFFALAQSGMTLREVRTRAGEWKSAAA